MNQFFVLKTSTNHKHTDSVHELQVIFSPYILNFSFFQLREEQQVDIRNV